MNRYRSFKGRYIFPFLLLILSILVVDPTMIEAHSTLEKTFPEASRILDKSPERIEAWFQDPVVVHSDSIKLIDSSGKSVSISKAVVDKGNAGHIVSNIKGVLKPGKYTVELNVLALDGYVINENFSFVIKDAINQSTPKEIKLLKSNLSDGEIYNGSPENMEMWFNQPVQVTALGIFDDEQQVVGIKEAKVDPNDPTHVIIPFTNDLSPGTYQVTWYASSIAETDNQIQNSMQGVFYFSIDEFTSIKQGQEGTTNSSFLNFSLGLKQIAYWLSFIGLTVLVGLAWFDSAIIRKLPYILDRKKTNLLVYIISIFGFLLLIVHHRQELPQLSLIDLLGLKFTWIPIIQFLLISIGLWLKRFRIVLYSLALLLWPFIIGHASYPRYGEYLTMTITFIHVLAASIWMGGLIALLAKPKNVDGKDWIRSAGKAFSKWALYCIIVIILSGIWMTVQFLPSFSFDSLAGSEWGRSLLVKTVFFLLIVLVGFFQRRALKRLKSKVVHSFTKKIRVELIYGLIIFFFAATLVSANPSAAEQGVYFKGGKLDEVPKLSVDISPFKIGLNTFTLKFTDSAEIKDVRVKLSMLPYWEIEHKAFKVREGEYRLTGNLLHAAGTIGMKVKVTMENGEVVELPYKVVVPGEIRFNES